MRRTCQEVFLKHIRNIQHLPKNQLCKGIVLILDEHTTQILSPIIQTNFLFDNGIHSLTKSSLKKKPQPHSLAIYFLSSSSLPHIIRDFQTQPIFYSINLLMSQPITPQIMGIITKEDKIIERLAFFGQLTINTLYYGDKIAIISNQNTLQNCWEGNIPQAKLLGKQLLTAIICGFGDIISIDVFYYTSSFCQEIVKELEKLMKEHIKEFASQYQNNEDISQVKVVIADRKFDIISPLIRSFYYYPMLYDMFNVQQQLKPKVSVNNTEIPIDSQGRVWNKYKNMHINKALVTINDDLITFKSQNQVAQFQANDKKGIAIDTKNIKNVIKQLPQYNKTVASFNNHITLMEQLIVKAKEFSLTEIGELQHTIVSGLSSKGQPQKDKKIISKCIKIIQNTKVDQIKIRLLTIMILGLQLSQSEKQSAIKQLSILTKSQSIQQVIKLSGKLPFKKNFENKEKKETLFLDRHQCKLRGALQNFLNDKIDKQFRNAKFGVQPKQQQKSKFKKKGEIQPTKKWLLYMSGGISNTEINAIQKLFSQSKSHQINIISQSIYNPDDYVNALWQIFKK